MSYLWFKSFILTFEQKEPPIHPLNRMLVRNLRLFLGYFMKFEGLNNTISDTLISLDIANNFQILKKLYVRDINKKFIVFVTKK